MRATRRGLPTPIAPSSIPIRRIRSWRSLPNGRTATEPSKNEPPNPTSAAPCASAPSPARSFPGRSRIASTERRPWPSAIATAMKSTTITSRGSKPPALSSVRGPRARLPATCARWSSSPTIRGSSAASITPSSRRIRGVATRFSSRISTQRSPEHARRAASRRARGRSSSRNLLMKLCGFEAGLDRPLFLIAGPCVVESEQLQIDVAGRLKETCAALSVPFIFKSSYDKANRSSSQSFRGLGMEEGLRILSEVKRQIGVPVLTDVHSEEEIPEVARVVDVLQTPAFLCRQTDFIRAVAAAGKPVNIKKGQFLAPEDMANVVAKAREASGRDNILVCERGATFGYHNLVADMRSLAIMRATGCPVVFDATHSVQLPGGQGTTSGGQREFVPVLARAAVAAGVAGVFMETHPDPSKALSDGPNAWPLARMRELLEQTAEVHAAAKRAGFPETDLIAVSQGVS